MVERAARSLFGRHVGRRSHHHAHLRVADRSQRGAALVGRANIFGQSEVQHLDAAFVRDHDIGGLQVAMHDALLMRRRQRVGQRTGNLDDLLDREPARRDQEVEWLSFDQLHGQKVDAVGFLHRVDSDDVRMVELGEGLGLTAKAHQPLRIVRHLGGQHLERYVAAEFRVGGAIHLAHATGADRHADFVGAEFHA